MLAAFWQGTALAQERSDNAGALLAAMSEAMRSLDYQGSFTYEHAGRTDTLRIFHVGGAQERERLVSLNGPRSEIIRSGFDVTCIQEDGSATVYTGSGRGLVPLVPATGAQPLDSQYDIRITGSDRVAGYRADIVDIAPRDRFRYGYRLWLDTRTHMLLRSVVTDAERRPLEQLMFVSLEIGVTPDDVDLTPQRVEATTAATTAPTGEVLVRGTPHWRVDEAPAGFEFVSARRPKLGPEGAEHLVYSDGLASVSIYIEPRGDAKPGFDTLAGRGIVNVFSRVEDTWRITVLGEVPLATVQAMGKGLRRSAPDS